MKDIERKKYHGFLSKIKLLDLFFNPIEIGDYLYIDNNIIGRFLGIHLYGNNFIIILQNILCGKNWVSNSSIDVENHLRIIDVREFDILNENFENVNKKFEIYFQYDYPDIYNYIKSLSYGKKPHQIINKGYIAYERLFKINLEGYIRHINYYQSPVVIKISEDLVRTLTENPNTMNIIYHLKLDPYYIEAQNKHFDANLIELHKLGQEEEDNHKIKIEKMKTRYKVLI